MHNTCNIHTINTYKIPQHHWKPFASVALSKKHHNIILINNSLFADSNGCLLPEYGRYSNPNDTLHLGRIGLKAFAANIKSYIVGKNTNISRSLNFTAAYRNGSAR